MSKKRGAVISLNYEQAKWLASVISTVGFDKVPKGLQQKLYHRHYVDAGVPSPWADAVAIEEAV